MLDQVLRNLQRNADHDLAIMKPGRRYYVVTCDILLKLKAVLRGGRADVVLVHGDTTSCFTALACSIRRFHYGACGGGASHRRHYTVPWARGVQSSGRGYCR